MTEALLIEPDPVTVPRRARSRSVATGLSAAWLVLLVATAILAPYLPFLEDPQMPSLEVSEGPSWDHWFGTDQLGRDVFARVAWGSRLSLFVALLSVTIGLLVGGSLGLLGGYLRGWIDHLLAVVVDVMLSLPALILALFIVTVLGQTVRNVVLALSILAIPVIARVVRAQTLTWAEREFVRAAGILGASRPRIVARELLPNLAPTIASFAILAVGMVIVAEGALSFIGVGVPPPDISWGRMLATGAPELEDAPQIVVSTASVMFLTLMALNFLGESIVATTDTRPSQL